jgi:hypothetical protein
MKPKPVHVLVPFGILVCLSLGAQAQETYQLENPEGERDRTYSPVDGETGSLTLSDGRTSGYATDTTSYANSSAGDTRQAEPDSKPAKQSTAQQGDGDKDSVLGFNFLYYIIQKFKMSDIVGK